MEVGIVAEQIRRQVSGGIGTYAKGLLRGLAGLQSDDLRVTALASRGPNPDPLRDTGVDVEASRFGHRVQVALWSHGLSAPPRWLDVLHLTSFAGPVVDRAGLCETVMIHDLGWRHHPELTTRRGVRWHVAALGRVLSSDSVIIVPSAPIAQDLTDAGADPSRVHVIGEGADHLPPPDLEAARAFLGSRGVKGAFVLTVSTLEPRKNLALLAEAHRQVPGAPPLVVVGPTGWGGETSVGDAVMAGPVAGDVLAGLYSICSLFVYVPVHEGFGLPPLEAMAHGAAVVASTAVPSMQGAPAMALVDPNDVAAVAAAIGDALKDADALHEASTAGRDHAGRHRWSDVAAAHVELWRTLS